MELKVPKATRIATVVVCTPLTVFIIGIALVVTPLLGKLIVLFFAFMFGIIAAASLIRIIYEKPAVLIGSDGIEDVRMRTGRIPWQEIRSIAVDRIKGLDHILISVRNPEAVLAKVPSWKRRALQGCHSGALRINIGNLRPPGAEVEQYLMLQHPDLFRRPTPG